MSEGQVTNWERVGTETAIISDKCSPAQSQKRKCTWTADPGMLPDRSEVQLGQELAASLIADIDGDKVVDPSAVERQ
jgi:hypothetical protein